jgi:ligand-binding SRPBCC domain-containing protein
VNAPIEMVFTSSLSIDLELSAANEYGIKAVGGVTSGIIGAGERVTWQVKQFGLWVSHTTEISRFEEPTYFQDRMVQGLFRSFSHDHFFRSVGPSQTEMRDEMSFAMPLFLTGKLAELFFVKHRLSTLLTKRNRAIKTDSEGSAR